MTDTPPKELALRVVSVPSRLSSSDTLKLLSVSGLPERIIMGAGSEFIHFLPKRHVDS